MLKVYPVASASAEDAAYSLEECCMSVFPSLREKVDCIQTGAGTQFNSQKWRKTCASLGLTHRTCPVDHQAMNGQLERIVLIA